MDDNSWRFASDCLTVMTLAGFLFGKILRYQVRCFLWSKDSPQELHPTGLSPVWVLWIWLRCVHLQKAFPYLSLQCCSPVWILWGWVTDEQRLKASPHAVYWQGFCPVWLLTCWVREQLSQKALLYFLYSKYSTPVWMLLFQKGTTGWGKIFP